MAETLFISNEVGKTSICSGWIKDFVPYAKVGVPFIEDDKLVINVKSQNIEVNGYINMLLIAKLLGNYDCIGKGMNAGYLSSSLSKGQEISYRNAKIDPGSSSSNSHGAIQGIVLHLYQKIAKLYDEDGENLPDFLTNIPLDMLDQENPLMLNFNFKRINMLLEYYSPNYDTRDLLIDKLPYAEILKSKKLYHQLAFAVEAVINANDEDLYSLIYDQFPESINGEDLTQIKLDIFNQIKLRQQKIHQLYKMEAEYIKIYRELGESINFEEMKILAQQQAINTPLAIDILMDHETSINIEILASIHLSSMMGQYKNKKPREAVLISILSMKFFMEIIETENFALVSVILKHCPDIASQINNVVSLSVNEGTTALMRTKEHDSSEIAELLLEYGANPRKQILGEEYIDITEQLPKWLQEIILARESAQGFSYSEIDDLEDLNSDSDSLEFEFTSEMEEIVTLPEYTDRMQDIIGEKYLEQIPNFFDLVNGNYFNSKCKEILQYIDYFVQKLDKTLLYHNDEESSMSLTAGYIMVLEDVFLSLREEGFSIFSLSKNLLPTPDDGGGDDFGEYGGSGLIYYPGSDQNEEEDNSIAFLGISSIYSNNIPSSYLSFYHSESNSTLTGIIFNSTNYIGQD